MSEFRGYKLNFLLAGTLGAHLLSPEKMFLTKVPKNNYTPDYRSSLGFMS